MALDEHMVNWKDRLQDLIGLSDPAQESSEQGGEEQGSSFTPFRVTPWFFANPLEQIPRLGAARRWSPRIDVLDRGDTIIVVAELPYVNIEDIHVIVHGDTLTIEGERRRRNEIRGERYYHSELYYGRFRREIYLPVEVNQEDIDAEYDDGVLFITLRKSRPAGPPVNLNLRE